MPNVGLLRERGCRRHRGKYLSYCSNIYLTPQAVGVDGTVVILTTIVCAVAGYYEIRVPPSVNQTRKIAAKETSLVFSDSIALLAVMAAVSFYITFGTKKITYVYEFVLAQSVALMAGDAALVLLISLLYEQERRPFRFLLLFLSSINILLTSLVVLNMHRFPLQYRDFRDMACYTSDATPPLQRSRTFAMVSLTLVSTLLSTLLASAIGMRMLKLRNAFRVMTWLVGPILSVVIAVAFVEMWVLFLYIVRTRANARSLFGSSYEDNDFGYGQILASGFCLQLIVQYAFYGMSKYQCSCRLQTAHVS